MNDAARRYSRTINSAEEADELLRQYQRNKAVVITGLRDRIAFLEARLCDRHMRRGHYEGVAKLQDRIVELEAELERCS
jgi:hypothetical protein